MTSTNHFNELLAINVDKHVEYKGKLKYMSWSHALAEIIKRDPAANWEFHEPTTFPDGSMLVWCSFTAFDKTIRMHLPVMDNRNQAVQNPNSRDVSDTMMRCLVKAIAAHGLGLSLYSKDGIPADELELSDSEKATIRSVFVADLTHASSVGMDKLKAVHTDNYKRHPEIEQELWDEWGEKLKEQAQEAEQAK